LHIAFEEVRNSAARRGIEVTGSELVGLIPLKAMLDAGRYFLEKQHHDTEVSDRGLIETAARELGLSQLSPFVAGERIIEYLLKR